jgi:hypothetical protein
MVMYVFIFEWDSPYNTWINVFKLFENTFPGFKQNGSCWNQVNSLQEHFHTQQ